MVHSSPSVAPSLIGYIWYFWCQHCVKMLAYKAEIFCKICALFSLRALNLKQPLEKSRLLSDTGKHWLILLAVIR